ncbi:hypothetical protein D9753_13425 [Streptomyces dangxiongensis]|uniref:Uncharacterized protein n=1 Tax=Streptomyces dangxiongensis TaxID=1442032 RepID=A0A3G2JC45_9ACTN|nr:hypothetical protein D9753_13425 [Streptomyces dangxiongensis]
MSTNRTPTRPGPGGPRRRCPGGRPGRRRVPGPRPGGRIWPGGRGAQGEAGTGISSIRPSGLRAPCSNRRRRSG